MAVFGYNFEFISGRRFFLGLARQHAHSFLGEFRCEDLRDIHLERFIICIADDLFAGFVNRGVVTLEIVGVDNVVSVFKQVSIAFLTFTKACFYLFAFGVLRL